MISKVKDKTVYQSLVDTSTKLFELLTKNLDVNSAYIAKKVGNKMTVINSYNKVEFIIPDDIAVDYQESNCKLVLENNEPAKTVMNLMADEETKKRKITDELGVKAFIGVPLNRTDGSNFGTLCLMDKDEKTFTNEQVEMVQSIADVLSYIIELDDLYEDIDLLSVPIIPISKGIAILALQGNVNDKRERKILEDTLNYTLSHKISSFLIDLSEMQISNYEFSDALNRLVSALKLMGVKVMLSGIPTALASSTRMRDQFQDLEVTFVRSIEGGLKKLGYQIVEREEEQ
ncbi:GAF domain-containing protein [Cytobacillus kochii]